MEYKEHTGLSPSSLALFSGCARKYFLRKIAKVPVDPDATEDQKPFQVGKAFHQVLEDTKHNLSGLTYSMVELIAAKYGVTDDTPMLFAMLSGYKKTHEKSGLKAIACEVVIETPKFYGIVDVVLDDGQGGFWIGDMKTSGKFFPLTVLTLPNHPQLSLYASHVDVLANTLGLDPKDYKGCRYRMTLKAELVQKKGEELSTYIARLAERTKTYDYIIPKEMMNPAAILSVHDAAISHMTTKTEEKDYVPNYGNCTSYFRPCDYWSRCHGRTKTEMQSLDFILAEDY